MERGWKLVIALLLISISAFLIFNITGKITDNGSSSATVTTGACSMNSASLCQGGYVSNYDSNNCPIYTCPSCTEGDVKSYTCPNGTKVDWCHCTNNQWICINSPEITCVSQTCSMPVCGSNVQPRFTGYEGNCPTYVCPEMNCSPGLGSEYICPDGTRIPECNCTSEGKWICIENPREKCSTPTCPEGCICNENTVACNYRGNITETNQTTAGGAGEASAIVGVCPTGCLCTDNQTVCDKSLTSKGDCAMGCELNGNCILPGIRASVNNSNQYCDINSEWKIQKITDETCNNNFECETNLCIDGKCITHNFIEQLLEWFRKIFGGK